MGKKSGSAPAAPDPAATAAAQTATNKETAYWNAVLNNVNQITPYGSLTYTQNQNSGPQYNMAAYNAALDSYNKALANGAQAGTAPSSRTYNAATGQWSDPISGGGNYAGAMPTLEQFKTSGGMDSPPSFTSTVKLSDDQQAILDSEERRQIALGNLGEDQIGRIRNSVSSPYSYDGLPGLPSYTDINGLAKSGQDAIMSRLDPQFAKDEEALRSRLINQGIGQGSEAYNNEFDRFNQAKTDARNQAILQGQNYGGAELAQMLGLRNQAIQEYDTQRNAPLNEYIGLTSGVQVQNPQFSSTGYQGAQPVDYAGLVNNQYQAQLGQYNQKVAGNNSTMGSLFGLGGSLLGGFAGSPAGGALISGWLGSDERLKTNKKKIGEQNGFPVYEFSYKTQPNKKYVGVMAQDILAIKPEAVKIDEESGYYHVNYDMIGFPMREVANG